MKREEFTLSNGDRIGYKYYYYIKYVGFKVRQITEQEYLVKKRQMIIEKL